jgi:CubicO group peptidase (beta-lactamase class C family)
MKKLSLLAALLIPFYTSCQADTDSKLDQYIQSSMTKYHAPGASIAIIKNNKIIYSKAYGYADVTTKRAMTTNTLLQACSITKTTTSLAVLLSLANHHLNVNTQVNEVLTSWQVPKNEFTIKQPVTIRMLLDHSAGILNPYANYFIKSRGQTPTALQMLKGEAPAKNQPLKATYIPGSKYEYCNGCYVTLQQVLEDINHKLYVPLMQSLVLTPLKLEHSTYDVSYVLDHPTSFALPYSPEGHVYDDAPFMVMMKDLDIRKKNINGNAGVSVGGLWTTPSDLATFAIAIQQSLANEKGSYIPHNVAEGMVTPSSTKTRGLGFFITNKYGDETPNGKYFMHGGFNQGYLAIFVASKAKNGDGIFIMVNVSPDYNTQDVYEWGFIKNVEKYVADHYYWK